MMTGIQYNREYVEKLAESANVSSEELVKKAQLFREMYYSIEK